jgi:lipopolysaccharide heptosyltransferase II
MMSPGWSTVENVLCVRLDTIGDVLMTTPAMRALKESLRCRVTLLTSSTGARIAPLVPEVDDVIVYDAPWMKTTSACAQSSLDLQMIDALGRGRFDAAVVFTVYTQSALPAALMCYLADVPRRLAHCRENPYHLLTDWVAEPEPEVFRHEVRRQLDLVAHIGCRTWDERLSLALSDSDRTSAAGFLERAGVPPDGNWAVFHPGGSAPARRYPGELFARAADELAGRGWRLVFTGDAAEVPLVESIRSAMSGESVSFAGRLGLPQMAALIEKAPVLVSNNTAPVHMAAALGTPVVDLYALTNPQHEPWLVPSRVLNREVPCRNCFKSLCPEGHQDCLRGVPPGEVASAAESLVAAAGRRPIRRETAGQMTVELVKEMA